MISFCKLFHKVPLKLINEPGFQLTVAKDNVSAFRPDHFLDLKVDLWQPLIDQENTQQESKKALRQKLIEEMKLPIYRMKVLEIWNECKLRLRTQTTAGILSALKEMHSTLVLPETINVDLKSGKELLKFLRTNNILQGQDTSLRLTPGLTLK